jgi:hypothetical protein
MYAAMPAESRALGGPVLQVGKYFRLKERNSTFTTELRAGTVTFLTVRRAWVAYSWGAAWYHGVQLNARPWSSQMAYILTVNALILSDTGGPCGPNNCTVRRWSSSMHLWRSAAPQYLEACCQHAASLASAGSRQGQPQLRVPRRERSHRPGLCRLHGEGPLSTQVLQE